MSKRIFDFISSLIVLLLLAPFGLVLGLLIVLDSRGGVFYRQIRVGKGNRDFKLIKFRTMRPNSDKLQITVGDRDPRVTRIGFFLRKYKLDELPQLLNILVGDMSVVGPRPEVRKYVDLYTPEQMRVLSVRPGLTDYASLRFVDESEILGRSEDPEKTYIEQLIPTKTRMALEYIDNRSFLGDIKIIFATMKRIIR